MKWEMRLVRALGCKQKRSQCTVRFNAWKNISKRNRFLCLALRKCSGKLRIDVLSSSFLEWSMYCGYRQRILNNDRTIAQKNVLSRVNHSFHSWQEVVLLQIETSLRVSNFRKRKISAFVRNILENWMRYLHTMQTLNHAMHLIVQKKCKRIVNDCLWIWEGKVRMERKSNIQRFRLNHHLKIFLTVLHFWSSYLSAKRWTKQMLTNASQRQYRGLLSYIFVWRRRAHAKRTVDRMIRTNDVLAHVEKEKTFLQWKQLASLRKTLQKTIGIQKQAAFSRQEIWNSWKKYSNFFVAAKARLVRKAKQQNQSFSKNAFMVWFYLQKRKGWLSKVNQSFKESSSRSCKALVLREWKSLISSIKQKHYLVLQTLGAKPLMILSFSAFQILKNRAEEKVGRRRRYVQALKREILNTLSSAFHHWLDVILGMQSFVKRFDKCSKCGTDGRVRELCTEVAKARPVRSRSYSDFQLLSKNELIACAESSRFHSITRYRNRIDVNDFPEEKGPGVWPLFNHGYIRKHQKDFSKASVPIFEDIVNGLRSSLHPVNTEEHLVRRLRQLEVENDKLLLQLTATRMIRC
eukprot:768429-Hanusia_phi.AAC.19